LILHRSLTDTKLA